jgi:hypothetical protein
LNDYARGALEALAWVMSILDEPKVRCEIEGARDDILNGTSVDFRRRLRMR